MRHFALRLVVALLTFGVGIAASTLFNFNSSRKPHRCVAPEPSAVLVLSPSLDSPPAYASSVITMKTRVAGGVLNGKAISKPMPVYPPIAKAAHVQGAVVVEVVVDENGDVISAIPISGPPLLQQAAKDAAQQAKFTPTRLDSKPVEVTGTLTYNFALE